YGLPAHDAVAADQHAGAKHHASSESPCRAEPAGQPRPPRRAGEVRALMLHLLFWRIAERLDAAEHDANIRAFGENFRDGGVMPFRNDVVVVQKMDEISLRERPAQVPDLARYASGRHWIFQVSHPGVTDTFNDALGGRFRTVVDDNDFHRYA